MQRRFISFITVCCIVFNVTACNVVDTAKEKAISAKDSVVSWYESLDFSKFKDGWEKSKEFVGAQYSAAVSSEYVANVQASIADLKTNINSAAGSARGTAQEAGFLAEQWATDTFNINAVANGSKERATRVGSNDLGSPDVTTTYGEKASLKYYQSANANAQKQAMDLLSRYYEYCSKSANPKNFRDYINENKYNPDTMDELLASNTAIYDGQTRIIPADQMEEAARYLRGEIDSVTANGGTAPVLQDTLDNLRDRLKAPDGTESTPISYDEIQAVAELAKEGKFKPEDFGIKTSTMISPKYVLKTAMGTGLTAAALNAVFTVGPDLYTIIKNSIEAGGIDEAELKKVGLESAIAASEGFVEGSVCSTVTTLCQAGVFGAALEKANPSVVATITILVIEAAINGYKLSTGQITAEEYGNLMADRVMISLIAIPAVELMLLVCGALKIPLIFGCLAGSLLACIGYTLAKEAVLDIVDGGGFEAVVPKEATDALSVAKNYVSDLNIKERASSFGDTVVTTANDGLIRIKGVFK